MKINLHVKKGDTVQILTGSEKGKKGKILRSFPVLDKVIVEGINLKKKNVKSKKKGEKGTLIEVAYPLHVSNVKKI